MSLISRFWAFFLGYWELSLLLATWAGIASLALRRRRDWRRKRFTEQVNFSLNTVETDPDGTARLVIRTLLEDSATHVWLNDYGVRQVQRAAERTTEQRPFLEIRPRKDMELVKHAVLNVLAERYSEAFLARAIGVEVRAERFLYGITWERYGRMYTQKLRVMVIRPADLERLCGEGGMGRRIRVAAESHRDRIATLERMHALHTSPDEEQRAMLGEVELGVVVPVAG
jgi:hypothetical protein